MTHELVSTAPFLFANRTLCLFCKIDSHCAIIGASKWLLPLLGLRVSF